MFYDAELTFFQSILKNFNLPTRLITSNYPLIKIDFGLREMLYGIPDLDIFSVVAREHIHPNTIYRTTDSFLCKYISFLLPDTQETTLLLIGPYLDISMNRQILVELMEKLSVPPQLYSSLEKYYSNLPTIADENMLFVILTSFGERIWNGMERFTTATMNPEDPIFSNLFSLSVPASYRGQESDNAFRMQSLETRYAVENELINAVSHGLSHKVETLLSTMSPLNLEQRVSDPIRNQKNYAIIMNTLFRKAAESGAVHPFYIDRLSSEFARKIELINSPEAVSRLQRDMIHKYCLLVKNHSMKGFSLLVQKVITHIDSDLTADLSLKAQSEWLNVNPSYLSALFKKETGSTLTEYVNRKRVEHAILLLNSTTIQIQTIAQYCGIPDVNYFTKLFKKYIGKTPKEYREDFLNYSHGPVH
ncbi:MAG: helix-turn-helix domain-containing protein [Lachnospiraceae bacterium]|nr:helix-turn-helix domain-containing protein [Lachnospiraceae bacterium]